MLQFRVGQLFGILTKLHGMALPGEDGLRLAFHEPRDAEGKRLLDVNVRDVLIDWSNLESIDVQRGLLGDQVIIQVKSIEPLRAMMQLVEKQIVLETRRGDREALDEFERTVAAFRSGQKQDCVDEMIDDIRDFLDRS